MNFVGHGIRIHRRNRVAGFSEAFGAMVTQNRGLTRERLVVGAP